MLDEGGARALEKPFQVGNFQFRFNDRAVGIVDQVSAMIKSRLLIDKQEPSDVDHAFPFPDVQLASASGVGGAVPHLEELDGCPGVVAKEFLQILQVEGSGFQLDFFHESAASSHCRDDVL